MVEKVQSDSWWVGTSMADILSWWWRWVDSVSRGLPFGGVGCGYGGEYWWWWSERVGEGESSEARRDQRFKSGGCIEGRHEIELLICQWHVSLKLQYHWNDSFSKDQYPCKKNQLYNYAKNIF